MFMENVQPAFRHPEVRAERASKDARPRRPRNRFTDFEFYNVEVGNSRLRCRRPSRAASRPPQGDGRNYLPKSGAIFLQASTRDSTDATDFSNMPRSVLLSSISTMRSTPLLPMTTGTPT